EHQLETVTAREMETVGAAIKRMMAMLRRFLPRAAFWLAAGLVLGIWPAAWPGPKAPNAFRAGAARVDITPKAEMLTPTLGGIHDPLFARAIVIDNGETRAAIVAA